MGDKKGRLKAAHVVLLVLFVVSAAIAGWLWLSGDSLEEAGIAATVALFWATASAFVERIYARDD